MKTCCNCHRWWITIVRLKGIMRPLSCILISGKIPISLLERSAGAWASCVTWHSLYVRGLHPVDHTNNELSFNSPLVSIYRVEITSGRPKDLSCVEMTDVSSARGYDLTSCSTLASNLWQLPSLVSPLCLSLTFFSRHSASAVLSHRWLQQSRFSNR